MMIVQVTIIFTFTSGAFSRRFCPKQLTISLFAVSDGYTSRPADVDELRAVLFDTKMSEVRQKAIVKLAGILMC